MNNNFNKAKEVIKQVLRDFKASKSNITDITWERGVKRISVDRTLFPVPNLILFVLNGVCGFPLGYRGEKTHWIIPFSYKEVYCAISFEKFGIRLYISKQTQVNINENELLGNLRKSINIAEKNILANIAKNQIKKGNITILNQFHRLDSQYIYFRNNAEMSYKNNSVKSDNNDIKDIAKLLNSHLRANQEGGYNALAMIDAYFSRLEHFLVLALPFSGYKRDKDDLTDFVGKIWSEKIKRIFDIQQNPMNNYYNRLVTIKEKYRNTFAHGGFEKKGASFYFHLPKYGAIPAKMSGHKDSVHFNFFPIEEETFREICSLFDELDLWLREIGAPYAWKFAISGLNMRFDEKYISEMLSATSDPKTFEEWINKESYLADMYANVDY